MRADKKVKGGGLRKRKGPPPASKPKSKESHSKDKKKASVSFQDDELLANIRALGGDEEDLKLINGVESDDTEEFSDHEINAKTTKEINSFLKTLNFKAVNNTVPDEEDEPKDSNHKKKEKKKEKEAKKETAATDEPQPPASDSVKKQLAAVKLNIPASSRWYITDLSLPPTDSPTAVSQSQLASLRSKAENLHASLPPPPSTSKSDEQFISNILASGTLSDRLSALTLMAQSSPIHNTRALESLKTMASKKGREESLKALRAVVDWWVGGGAPDRKLKYFADQPLTHPGVTDSHLTLWYFEDWLKKYFFSILQLLETLSLDLLAYIRMQAMSLIFQLLDAKPEQEQNLLRLLVNKLGDSEKTVASKASYQLLQILQHHPGMKSIIIREITSLILRPPTITTSSSSTATRPGGQSSSSASAHNQHARYYSIITLNQITLSASEQTVAGQLVDLYFTMFREILNEGGHEVKALKPEDALESKGKKGDDPKKGKHIKHDRKGKAKLANGKPSSANTNANEFSEVEDTDSKTISAILSGVNRAFPFAKTDDSAFDGHIDTLFRITHTATFNVSIQALVLIFQVTSGKESVSDRFYRTLYQSVFDPRLVLSSKQAMWLNLIFKAVKADKSQSRICAFVKRILQALGMHQPPFICGALYMLGQLLDSTPGIRDMMHVPQGGSKSSSSKSKTAAETTEHPEVYDPRKRDPQYAHAETTCLWELVPLLYHFHPSVSLHARQILTSVQVTATPDLALNTLSHFLDRFVYKNPKKPKPRGASAMQPAAAAQDESGMVRLIRGGGADLGGGKNGTVNEESFWKKSAADVPVDQLFFHKFFLNKLDKAKDRSKKVAKRKRGDGDEDDDSENASDAGSDPEISSDQEGASDEEQGGAEDDEKSDSDSEGEAEIWKAMQRTMPGPKADLDLMEEDSDDIPSGLDDDDSDSDGDDVEGDGGEVGEDDEAEDAEIDEDEDDAEDNFVEDEGDLVDLSDDAPDDLPWTSAFEAEDSETVSGKRKPSAEDTQKGGRKRRRFGQLPTFASYEDYAKLIEEGPEDNI